MIIKTEILALNYELRKKDNVSFYNVNIEFRINKESDCFYKFENASREFIKAPPVYNKNDVIKYENNEISYGDLLVVRYKDLYQDNDDILSYDSETNVFTFKEYVTNTFTVRGALQELEFLRGHNEDTFENVPVRFTFEEYIFLAIQTLSNYWD